MSLVVGQRMVRTDDGTRGVVEEIDVTPSGGLFKEKRITYFDRGEKRIAGKREVWTPEQVPPRKLLEAEIVAVASIADRLLRAIEKNEPSKWWQWTLDAEQAPPHDPELVTVIRAYLTHRT